MAQPSWLAGEINAIMERASKCPKLTPPTTDDIVATLRREKEIDFPGIEMVVSMYRRDALKMRQQDKMIVKKRCDKIRMVLGKKIIKFPSKDIAK